MARRSRESSLALAFWGAVALTLVLHLAQPWGGFVLYPLALLVTWAHEMGHGLAAMLVGGRFAHLELYADLGGVAYTQVPQTGLTWRRPVVAAGGLLGPPIAGGLVVILGARQRTAPWVLGALAMALWLSLLLWVRNGFGMVAIAGLGTVLGALALWAPRTVRIGASQLIGIQLCLGSLSSFHYMFMPGFERNGQFMASDTQAIAEHLLLPYWFWGALIAALSVAILSGSFWVAWGRRALTARRTGRTP